ncbi:MAG: S1 family peptidase [Oscillospiraceae bacterium]|jgi:hypothetical protein|nr:S1 family peptidase [Oscillospiraceae bacterium]
MKKRITAIVAALFAMVVIFSGQAISQADANGQDGIVFVEDMLQDEAFVASWNEQLLAQYGEEYLENLRNAHSNDAKLMGFFPKDSAGESIYPDFIGGIYYNDDGNMVVQIVDDAVSKKSSLYNRVAAFLEEEGVITESVEFSFNELEKTMNALNKLYLAPNRPAAFDNMDSCAEDTLNNRIEVRMVACNEVEIARFKSTVLDSPILHFAKAIALIQTYKCGTTTTEAPSPTVINPGQGVLINSSIFASIGYRARLSDGTVGIVTAGHGGVAVNQSTTYGAVKKQQYSGNVDGAFIATNSSYAPSNYANGFMTFLTQIQTVFCLGDPIAKVGCATGYTYGVVTRPSMTGANGITGLVGTDADAAGGDSGGIVLAHIAPSHPGRLPDHYTAGILHGGAPGTNYTAIFCRADVINAAFGLTRY